MPTDELCREDMAAAMLRGGFSLQRTYELLNGKRKILNPDGTECTTINTAPFRKAEPPTCTKADAPRQPPTAPQRPAPSGPQPEHRDDSDGDASADLAKAACEAAGAPLPVLHHRERASAPRFFDDDSASAGIAKAARVAASGSPDLAATEDPSADIANTASAAAGGR